DFVLKVSAQVFDRRKLWLVLFALATLFFAWSATRLTVDAGFNKMVPLKHEYMKVYREYEKVFGGVNRVAIALVEKQGDIRDGTRMVVLFFGLAFLITIALMYWFLKAINLVFVSIAVALLPVLWLLGTLPLLGFGIDPLSILVPFLIFSIGVSHAVQMARSWERDVVSGTDSATAARRAFAKLFIPGTLALLTNVVGFAVIMLIPIDIVRELGITASLGVGWMILTNKVLLPLLLWDVKL